MEANELRIGNYINKFGIDYICDMPVSDRDDIEIVSVTIDVLKDIDNYDGTTDYPYYEEIPLTEEWLLKFGFEKGNEQTDYFSKTKYNLITKDSLTFYFYPAWKGIENKNFKHIKYVHQLQNLYFVLTGIELKTN